MTYNTDYYCLLICLPQKKSTALDRLAKGTGICIWKSNECLHKGSLIVQPSYAKFQKYFQYMTSNNHKRQNPAHNIHAKSPTQVLVYMKRPTWLSRIWLFTPAAAVLPCFKMHFVKDCPVVFSQKETDGFELRRWNIHKLLSFWYNSYFISFNYFILRDTRYSLEKKVLIKTVILAKTKGFLSK